MKKQVVKVTLNGSGQVLIIDYSLPEIGVLVNFLDVYDRIEVQVPDNLKLEIWKTCILVQPKFSESPEEEMEKARFVSIERLGVFSDHVDPGSGDVFTLELIEMDEKEIAALPEFAGW